METNNILYINSLNDLNNNSNYTVNDNILLTCQIILFIITIILLYNFLKDIFGFLGKD